MANASGYVVMEKAWEQIQKKTFTKWVNSHLAKRGQKMEEITAEFKDGLKFLSFLEIISGRSFSKYEKKPRMRIHYIQNIDLGLKLLQELKVPLVSIGAEDIADGNQKLILGMIWTIIQKFQIEDISEEQLSAKEALLLWCKKKTQGYRDVKVENFHTTWVDGLAFCALIHKHRPDLINFDELKKENSKENLQLAFDVAEKSLGIPKLLDVEDMVDVARPDERSVITYVSQYYHAFSSSKKQEVAARRIGRLVELTSSIEQMRNDYTERANNLAGWIQEKQTVMTAPIPDNLTDIKKDIADLNDHKQNQKPPKAAEKLALEALFNNIQLKLRSNNRPAFVPEGGRNPADIAKTWDALHSAERDREDALRKELERLERLDLLNRKLNNKADKLEAWIGAKEKYLSTDENVDSLNGAKEKLRIHEAFYDEYSTSKNRLTEVQDIAKEIASLNDPNLAAIQERVNKITDNWTNLQGEADKKKEDLKKKLEIEERKEQLRLDFSKLAKEYNRWVSVTVDQVNDHSFGENLEDVQAYKADLDNSDSAINTDNDAKKAAIDAVWAEMQQLGVKDVKYTVLTIKDVEARHASVGEVLKRRQEAYDVELKRQLEMEEKRKEFAKVAQEFIEHLTSRKQQIEQLTGEPEPLIGSIEQAHDAGKPEEEKLTVVQALNSQMIDMGINDNRHTDLTYNILQKRNQQFGNWIHDRISNLKEESELKTLYVEKAQELISWINETLVFLQERGFDNTLQGAQAKSAEFNQYKTGKKAEVSAKKPELKLIYNNIEALLKKAHRPEFNPPAGNSLQDIDALWAKLEEEEKKKEEDVAKELARQEKLAYLVRRFNSDAEDLENWAAEKEKYLQEQETIETLFKAQFATKLFDAFQTEYRGKEPHVSNLGQLKAEIVSLNFVDAATITARHEKVTASFANLQTLGEQKNQYLQEQLNDQQKKENLRLEFARLAKEFNTWVKQSNEAIKDYNFGFTLEAVTAHKDELDKTDVDYNNQANEKKSAIDGVWTEMEGLGVSDNRHTKLTVADIANLHGVLTEEIKKRQEAYEAELNKQKLFEEKRKEFATQAQAFVDFIATTHASLEKVEGQPQEKITKISEIHNGGAEGKNHLDQLSALATEMRSLGIQGNNHTKFTVPVLVTKNNVHNNYVNSLIQSLTEETEMNERLKNQEAELAAKEQVEKMVVEFSTKARNFNQWLESAEETLDDPLNVTSIEDAEKVSNEFSNFESQLASKKAEHDELVALAQKMQESGITDFSGVTIEDITTKYQNINTGADSKKTAIKTEHERQQANDAINKEFADKASSLNKWLEQEREALATHKGELQEQLNAVHSQISGLESKGKPQLQELEQINNKANNAGIKRNPYTDLTYRTVTFTFEQLKAAMDKQEKLLSNEILSKKNAEVPPEQVQEFKEVFQHFDRDGSGNLQRLEFKACLQTLGEEPTDGELDNLIKRYGQEGKIYFEQFITFMVNKTKDTDSKEELLESFKSVANDKDFVTEDDLRKVMDNNRVAYLIKNMPPYEAVSGGYDYKKWISGAYGH